MLSQLFIGNFSIFIGIVFIISTWVLLIKTLNLINPDLDTKLKKSRLFFQSFKKIMYALGTSLLLVGGYIIYITVVNKTINLLVYSLIGVITLAIFMVIVFKHVYIKVSDFELRVINIPNIQYTPDKIKIYKKSKLTISVMSVLSIAFLIASHIYLGVYVAYLSPIFSNILFFVAFVISYGLYLPLIATLDNVTDSILKIERGYISDNKLKELKRTTSLTNKSTNELKEMIKETKSKRKGN